MGLDAKAQDDSSFAWNPSGANAPAKLKLRRPPRGAALADA